MRTLLPVFLIVGVCGIFVVSTPISRDAPISTKLKFVANVDGKSYFADNTGRNWTEAGKFCENLGMKLADISTKSQADALNEAYSDPDFATEYWTSGRDAQEIRQFTWNTTGIAIRDDYPRFDNTSGTPYQTCLIYMSRHNATSGLKHYPCSLEWPKLTMMGKTRLTATLLFCFGVCGRNVLGESLKTDDPISTNLKMIATADGKSFFADSAQMPWFEAREYCKSLGLKLASVTSLAQHNALKAAYGPDFDGGYWTSGRDAQMPRQFSWDETDGPVSHENPDIRNYNDMQYQTCLFYWSRPDNDSALYHHVCSGRPHVLCST